NFYWTAVGLLLAAVWLFLRSYRLRSRLQLVLSCLTLAGSLLIFEAAHPLALLAALLAWVNRQQRGRPAGWLCAWGGTLTVLATRFLLYLGSRGSSSYQVQQSAGALRDPWVLLKSLGLKLNAGLGNFQTSGAALDHWKAAVCVLGLVLVLAGVV